MENEKSQSELIDTMNNNNVPENIDDTTIRNTEIIINNQIKLPLKYLGVEYYKRERCFEKKNQATNGIKQDIFLSESDDDKLDPKFDFGKICSNNKKIFFLGRKRKARKRKRDSDDFTSSCEDVIFKQKIT